MANAGAHHGSEGAGGRRRTHRSHCVSHQRALSASMNERVLQKSDGALSCQRLWFTNACDVCQIHAECKRFGKAYSLRSVAVYGGGSMWEQAKALQEGAEIVVCTPVRDVPPRFFSASNLYISLQQQGDHFLRVCVCVLLWRAVWSTTSRRRPRPCREWPTWCLMKQIACLTWALVRRHQQSSNEAILNTAAHFCFLLQNIRLGPSPATSVLTDRVSAEQYFGALWHRLRLLNTFASPPDSPFVQRYFPEEDWEVGQGYFGGSYSCRAGRHRRGVCVCACVSVCMCARTLKVFFPASAIRPMKMWLRWWSCCSAVQTNGLGWPGASSSSPPPDRFWFSSPRRPTRKNWPRTSPRKVTAWACCTETWTRVRGIKSSATSRKTICRFWWPQT